MLQSLYIKNFVLISELSLDFHNGFQAFIGETGAGKSILMDAISLVCGERASSDVVRRGTDKAIVEAVFSISDSNICKHLEVFGIEVEEGTLILTREVTSDGRSVSRVNHRTVNLSLLKEIGELLVDQHTQFDTVSMKIKGGYLDLLDRYCNHDDLIERYKCDLGEYKSAKKALESFENERLDEHELEMLEFAINELEEANIKENELEDIDDSLKRMSQSEHIKEKGSEALALLENNGGVLENLYSAAQALSAIHLDEVEKFEEELKEHYYVLEDLKDKISSFVESSFLDEEEYRTLQERGFLIRRLIRKYGGSYSSLKDELEEMKVRLEHASDHEEYERKLILECEKCKKVAFESATKLSESRKKMAKAMQKELVDQLKDLSLASATFEITFDSVELGSDGIDDVSFLVSMNKGEPLRPLMKCASGGELSRFMLGLKVVLAKREKTPVMIFDEIDSGISGATAYSVGEKMLALSKYTQVFSVTHLAQVAAAADYVYFISKSEDKNGTHSKVTELDDTSKLEKLALISSGNVSDSSIQTAKEMITKARGE